MAQKNKEFLRARRQLKSKPIRPHHHHPHQNNRRPCDAETAETKCGSGCKCPSRRLKRVAESLRAFPHRAGALIAVAGVGLASVLMVPLTFRAVAAALSG
jgi:hypothetical protein